MTRESLSVEVQMPDGSWQLVGMHGPGSTEKPQGTFSHHDGQRRQVIAFACLGASSRVWQLNAGVAIEQGQGRWISDTAGVTLATLTLTSDPYVMRLRTDRGTAVVRFSHRAIAVQ